MKIRFVSLATTLTLLIAMTFGMPSWAEPPRIPTDAVPQQADRCKEHDSNKHGICAIYLSPTSGLWLQFWYRGELVLIRHVPEPGAEHTDVWVRDGWNTF